MKSLPEKLQQKLDERKANNALRQLGTQNSLVDFSSNDYLGFSKNESIFHKSHQFLIEQDSFQNGSTGSRLLSGNSSIYNTVEVMLANFHNTEAALIYNSGYDANMGFFSSVPQRGDVILYDEFIHASIRDGMSMSHAKSYKFKHNNLEDLEKKCQTERSRSPKETVIYIATESVFSMDGDSPDLATISQISKKHNALLVIDEAHAVGVFGECRAGLIQNSNLEHTIFARIITFGKAMGCHGAAILGNETLKQYLINFSRSFIYTTALPPHSLATIHAAYNELVISNDNEKSHHPTQQLHQNIQYFKDQIIQKGLKNSFIESHSAIQCCIIPGNKKLKLIAEKIQTSGFDVKPILSPTVPANQERLRFCLHAYNSEQEISEVLRLLATFVL